MTFEDFEFLLLGSAVTAEETNDVVVEVTRREYQDATNSSIAALVREQPNVTHNVLMNKKNREILELLSEFEMVTYSKHTKIKAFAVRAYKPGVG